MARADFRGKGALCVALVVTNHAMTKGLPLDSEALLTEGGGQVLGLGKSTVQMVLERNGIKRVLASEGGRTSRGSIQNMRKYVGFLNDLARKGHADLKAVETFWIEQVNAFFAAKPFKIKQDASRSLRTLVGDVIQQAVDRQKTNPGMHYSGAVLQHLVGAKLDCVLGKGQIDHHSFSTADEPSGRGGDFVLGDVAIHVTKSPGEAVIERCRRNIDAGSKPIVVTQGQGVAGAEHLANHAGLGERIDIFDIEQFVALNLYELGKFAASGRRDAVRDLVDRYNEIVDECETDPSLRIELS